MMRFEFNETLEQALARNVNDALMEDIGVCDWTAQLAPPDERVRARVIAREVAVLCGQPWFEACIHALDPSARIDWAVAEGGELKADLPVCHIEANARAMLTAERPALNFLQMLSAVATHTRAHVQAIESASNNPRGCVILDTRKTLPGLRQAQKYAVRIGGGQNQRLALWDGILIKENHIAAAGGIKQVISKAAALNADVDIQIEVENLEQLQDALDQGARSIMLDNFSLMDMHAAVRINQGRALLEVSGSVQLHQLKTIAATGVDRISVGKLTKDIKAVDFSMRVIERLV